MTACKDSQATSGKKAVSATLAGVLAVGLVPAVALADEAVEVTEEDGITELTGDQAQDFSSSTINTYAMGTVKAGVTEKNSYDPKTKLTVPADGTQVFVAPLTVTPPTAAAAVTVGTATATAGSGAIAAETDYSITYYQVNSNGTRGAAVDKVINPGDYVSVVTTTNAKYEGGEIVLPFTVTAADLGTVTIKDAKGNAVNKVTYSGKEQAFDVEVAGATADQFTVKFVKNGGTAASPAVPVKDAGEYVAYVTGNPGTIYAGKTATALLTVKPFNLKDAQAAIADTTGSQWPTAALSVVNGSDSLDPSLVKLVPAEGSPNVLGANKKYTMSVMPATANDPNIICGDNGKSYGTGEFNKVGQLASFKYGKEALASSYTYTDPSVDADATPFAIANITAVDNAGTTVTSSTEVYAVVDGVRSAKPLDSTSTPTLASFPNTPGIYDVVVTASAAASNYAVGGTTTSRVTVVAGSIDANADAYISVDGKAVQSFTAPYDAAGPLTVDDFIPTVMFNGSPLDADDDYEFVCTDASGSKVAAGTTLKPGTYTFTIKPLSTFQITGTTSITATIEKIDLADLQVSGTGLVAASFNKDYKYLDTSDGDVALNGVLATYEMPSDANATPVVYTGSVSGLAGFNPSVPVSEKWQKLDEKTGEWVDADATIDQNTSGSYRLAVTPADVAASDYCTFATDEGTFLAFEATATAPVFADVLPGTWYYEPIAEAAQPKGDKTATPPVEGPDTAPYMNGYAGANLFGPNDAITRGQVACVLYNMAGGDALGFIPSYTENYGVDTGFSDVDGKMYYAKAIAWAKSTGVVNGFAGTDQFGPDDNITREQFAAMLANYAQKRGATLPSDIDGILAGISDGPSTSDWAKASVAWAVENEVMGRGGFVNPFGTASRAEVAAMAVNYQPRA